MSIKSGGAALLLSVFLLVLPIFARAQSTPIDAATALQYFREAQAASDRDGGKLWGKAIYGPLLFIDPATRMVTANQSDLQGLLTRKDEVFVGRLPETVPIANYTTTWGGVRWAMIVGSFMTPDKFQRVKLMMHESFHRVQNDLHFPVGKASNGHLDTLEGRLWLQLEWRALRQALTGSGETRRHAIEDALTFRNYRRSLFPNADASERALEMNEGLAEYTGFTLSARDSTERSERLAKALETGAVRPTYMGSFAYSSGPAYGVLLDTADAHWRKGLTPQQDLGELLQRSLKIKLSADLKAQAEKQASQYAGDALRATEAEREVKRQKQIAAYRKRFVDGPVLLLPLTDRRKVTFVSTNMVPLEGVGTVYPTCTVIDAWGVLEVSKGALMIQNEGGRIIQVYLSPPQDPNGRPLKGEGWTLKLASGWGVTPGSRKGDYLLKRTEP